MNAAIRYWLIAAPFAAIVKPFLVVLYAFSHPYKEQPGDSVRLGGRKL